jgi:NAD-dependent dihydropyrimidine dehydrogenase PreA subunit
MTYVITQPCIDVMDMACVQECPVDAIYQGRSMSYINPDECVDCGASEPVCPVEAIYYEDEVPPHLQRFKAAAVDFSMSVVGGGSTGSGRLDFDSPLIWEEGERASRNHGAPEQSANPVVLPPSLLESRELLGIAWSGKELNNDALLSALLIFDKLVVVQHEPFSSYQPNLRSALTDAGLLTYIAPSDIMSVVDEQAMWELHTSLAAMDLENWSHGPLAEPAHPHKWVAHAYAPIFRRAVRADLLQEVAHLGGKGLGALSVVLQQMLMQSLAMQHVSAIPISLGVSHASFMVKALDVMGLSSDLFRMAPEGVFPNFSEVGLSAYMTFRESHQESYRRHFDLLMKQIHAPVGVGMEGYSQVGNEILDSASALRRIAREQPWSSRGYGSLGMVGGKFRSLLTASEVRHAYSSESAPSAEPPLFTYPVFVGPSSSIVA